MTVADRAESAPVTVGAYRVLRTLGAGGMGIVYCARAPDDSLVAIKVFHPEAAASPEFRPRLLREAAVGLSVRHPNVVHTIDVGFALLDGRSAPFLVMEYAEGKTLRDLLGELDVVPEQLCRHIGKEVAAGLEAIHAAGAVHRDLKPENILITPDHKVKVMDLGVARFADSSVEVSQRGVFVGSVLYAAPEQFAGEVANAHTDHYSLGLILYELATGRHPYGGSTFAEVLQARVTETAPPAAEINPRLTPFFEEFLTALLATERDRRPLDVARTLDLGEQSDWWKRRVAAIRESTHRPLRRPRIPRETAIYGRHDELEKLRHIFDLAAAGHGQVLFLEGEPGIGKTRLVAEFVRGLAQAGRDFQFLAGTYPPDTVATGAGALSTAFREHFGAPGLEDELRGYVGAPELVSAFAAVLTGAAAPTERSPVTTGWLHAAFADTARSLAAERPTIIHVDDLHHAPAEGRAVFATLARALTAHRVLLIGAYRPGVPERWLTDVEQRARVTRLVLPRLGPRALQLLLSDALRSAHLAEELVETIHAKSDGNPLFVFEILRDLRRSAVLRRRADGTWERGRPLGDVRIPGTVRQLIRGRIAALTGDDRRLLEMAACCGFSFDPLAVAEALGIESIPVMERLAALETDARLVRSSGRRFVFQHHLVREALLRDLDADTRRLHHAALGDALAAQADGSCCATAYDLCLHFLRGDRPADALAHLTAALDHLEAGYLNEDAVDLADRMLAAQHVLHGAARVDLLLRQAKRLGILGRREEERHALEEARREVALLDDGTREAHVLAELGWHLMTVSRYRDAVRVLEQARDRARAAGDEAAEAHATGVLGSVCFEQARYDEARAYHEQRRVLARRTGDRRSEASATGNLAIVLWVLGQRVEAHRLFDEQRAICVDIGDLQGEAAAAGNLANVHHARGALAEARRCGERQLELCRITGDRMSETAATTSLGNVCHAEGRFEEAAAHFARAAELSRDAGHRSGEATATDNLGAVHNALGRLGDARAHHERALSIAREIDDRLGEARAAHNLGVVLSTLGRPRAAEEHLQRAAALAHGIRAASIEAQALRALGSVAEQRGDHGLARRRYLAALSQAERAEARGSLAAAAELVYGAFLARRGSSSEGIAHLREALTIAYERALPEVRVLATVRLACLGETDPAAAEEVLADHEPRLELRRRMSAHYFLWLATGNAQHLALARRLLDRMVANAPEHCRTAVIENVPLHRAIHA